MRRALWISKYVIDFFNRVFVHVEHWLNGRMTVEYELYSDEWEALVAASKFGAEEHYARAPAGSIGLQDHGAWVAYRKVRIKPLKTK